jgi:hypothetical protein
MSTPSQMLTPPEFRGLQGYFRYVAHHGKKPHVWPFVMGFGVALVGAALVPVTDEDKKNSMAANRAELMAKRHAH